MKISYHLEKFLKYSTDIFLKNLKNIMPFYEPYQTEFKQNDLIYGLSHVREYYIKNCRNFKASLNDNFSMIDEYHATLSDRCELKRILSTNEHLFLNTLNKHSKYKTVCTELPFKFNLKKPLDGTFTVEKTITLHRKCKGGLYWASESHKQEKGFTIHFLLDEIDFSQLITKSTSNDRNVNLKNYISHMISVMDYDLKIDELEFSHYSDNILVKERSVTGVELRWIFRNSKDLFVQKAIQFWYKGKPCCPPWEKNFDFICGEQVSNLWLFYSPMSHKPLRCQCLKASSKCSIS